jgi:hypothetical protein
MSAAANGFYGWILLILSAASPAWGDEPAVSLEGLVKAAFLPKVAAYVTWPASSFVSTNSPIVLGVLGRHPFGASFKTVLETQVVRGRPLRIREFAGLEEIRDCHLLYVCASEESAIPRILEHLAGAPVLTIGDAPRFAHRGGMIGYRLADERVQFEVNVETLAKAGLKVSPKFLQVAAVINERPVRRRR